MYIATIWEHKIASWRSYLYTHTCMLVFAGFAPAQLTFWLLPRYFVALRNFFFSFVVYTLSLYQAACSVRIVCSLRSLQLVSSLRMQRVQYTHCAAHDNCCWRLWAPKLVCQVSDRVPATFAGTIGGMHYQYMLRHRVSQAYIYEYVS